MREQDEREVRALAKTAVHRLYEERLYELLESCSCRKYAKGVREL